MNKVPAVMDLFSLLRKGRYICLRNTFPISVSSLQYPQQIYYRAQVPWHADRYQRIELLL